MCPTLLQQYRLECPNGGKRTYVYTHLPRMSTMLAVLCNLCDNFGHSNFDAMCSIAHSLSQVEKITIDCHGVVKSLRAYQTFLKTKLAKSSERHSTCKRDVPETLKSSERLSQVRIIFN